MHLDKQLYKNQNMKYLPQRYNYSSNNTISLFKQVKFCKICPLENFKTFLQDYVFICQPACQPVNRNRPRAYTTKYIAFKLPDFHWHEPLLFQSQSLLYAIACLLFIHFNQLIFLLEIKVLTFNHGINISSKVLKLNSKQLAFICTMRLP